MKQCTLYLKIGNDMKTTKVYIKLTDGDSFFGELFHEDELRIQDLMNDERAFIPVILYKTHPGATKENKRVTTIINKMVIAVIEER